jgi:AhpD family alkylhydroperoxidase
MEDNANRPLGATTEGAPPGGEMTPGDAWSVRMDWAAVDPRAGEAMLALERYVHTSGLPAGLVELVKIRASQLNGCAYCLDMHTKDARAAGEREQRIYALSVWWETPFFTPAERAALAWTEAVTRIDCGVSDAVYDELARHFAPRDIVALTAAVVAINAWNRWAVSMRTEPGTYRPDLAR